MEIIIMKLRHLRTRAVVITIGLFVSVTLFLKPGSASNDDKPTKNLLSCLYPQASETRDLKTLDGVWNFRLSPPNCQSPEELGWHKQDLTKTGPAIPMPVPSSYNDITSNKTIHDHVGVAWYDRRFFVSPFWIMHHQRVWLRFSSVHYAAKVWVNGILVGSHEIGHLPFAMEISHVVLTNYSNLLTVAVNNTLTNFTVPQGTVNNKRKQEYTFDFFNYAGIHRSVFLYSTPKVYIDDVAVNMHVQNFTGYLAYNVACKGTQSENTTVQVELFDRNDKFIVANSMSAGLLEVPNVNLWWPYLMHNDPGYLYILKVWLKCASLNISDSYKLKVGFRTIKWNSKSVLINDKPIYFRGFGMHEDSDWRGKGWDLVLWTKNFDLIKWTGANAFRTSHYPYAEEIYQMADEQGIMIIDECPSVNTASFSPDLLRAHKQSLGELILRDRNHPSVVMWSIANEPETWSIESGQYFQKLSNFVKTLDQTRPVTVANSYAIENNQVAPHLDVISFNRYIGWYEETSDLRRIVPIIFSDASWWNFYFQKPIIMAEYGADTISGMHSITDSIFSEEYQVALMSEHFKAFDRLRKTGFFVGEFIWNFADFMTQQGLVRVGGNRKGIFTRSREPKAAAYHLRTRYHALAAADAGRKPPTLELYISDHRPATHVEL